MAANGLITDLYQLTMANALFKKGMHERRVVFDRFYRKNPFNGGYTVVAGLAHLQEFAKNFRFDAEDIAYLKSHGRHLCHAGRHGRIPGRAPAAFPWHHDRGDADGDRALDDHEP